MVKFYYKMNVIKTIFAGLVTILVERGEIKLSEDLYIDGSTILSRAFRRKIKKWRILCEFYNDATTDSGRPLANIISFIATPKAFSLRAISIIPSSRPISRPSSRPSSMAVFHASCSTR